MKKVIVIGGGASGMMAAYAASLAGAEVTLLEKNEKTGKKIYITGKGRCNLTNDCDAEDFFKNVVTNPKFLYSAYYSFDSSMVMDLFESNGCPLKTERGQRVFPVSDHSSDVIGTLNRLLKGNNVDVKLNTTVTGVGANAVYTNKGKFEADSIIIATGGFTYPSTGSTGDGYKFGKDLGHSIKNPVPALVPLCTKEEDYLEMQGLALKNVTLTMYNGSKKVFSDFGEMLFTHFGISGPLVLSASSTYVGLKDRSDVKVSIDLKSALSFEELDSRVLRDFGENQNKEFKNSLDKLLPSTMIPVIVRRSNISPEKKVHEITREERRELVRILKGYELTVTGTRDVNEAIITQGGINVKEINPSTMESKIVPGIYFCGEVLDTEALTGGFNLQIAWSTGYLAGISAAE